MSIAEELEDVLAIEGHDLAAASSTLLGLAARVASAEDAARFASVVSHVVGEEAGNWALARSLIVAVQDKYTGSVGVQGNLAVASYMTGEWMNALVAEARAGAAAKESATAVGIWIRLSTAHALQRKGNWPDAFRLLEPTIDLAREVATPSRHDASIAALANNLATDLLDLDVRSKQQETALERVALLSRAYWFRAGSWIHQERADYLLALAYNALGRHHEARESAARGLATIDAHGDEAVDRAFLNVELAVACKALQQTGEFKVARDTAHGLAQRFDDPGLKQWFDAKFARVA